MCRMRQGVGPPHPNAISFVCSDFSFAQICRPPDEAQPSRDLCDVRIRDRCGIEVVSMKFAQAVIVEAELHRRRFPNLACGGSRVHST